MIKPLKDNILIKVIKKEEKTKGGIILANNLNLKYLQAEVIETGYGKDNIQLEKGQKIIVKEGVGYEINYNNEDYLIVDQTDILATID